MTAKQFLKCLNSEETNKKKNKMKNKKKNKRKNKRTNRIRKNLVKKKQKCALLPKTHIKSKYFSLKTCFLYQTNAKL